MHACGLRMGVTSNPRRAHRTHSVNSWLLSLVPPKRAPAMLLVEEPASEAPCSRPSHPARKRNVSSRLSIRDNALTRLVDCSARKPEASGTASFQPRKVKKANANANYRDRATERRTGADHEFTHVSSLSCDLALLACTESGLARSRHC